MSSSKIPLRLLSLLSLLVAAGALLAQTRLQVPMAYSVARAEQPAYGPSALRIAPDGTFCVVNPVDNTLTSVGLDGRAPQRIRVDEAAGITDVQFSEGGEMTVLDAAADTPALLGVSTDGSIRERRDAKAAKSIMSRAATNGQEDELQARSLVFDGGNGPATEGWRIRAGTDADPNALLTRNGVRIEVSARRGVMRGVRILSERADGIYVLAEEVADGETIAVDVTVRHYALSGELRGIARYPLAAQFTYVESPVAISSDGRVWALETEPDAAVITELAMTDAIPEILPDRRQPGREVNSTAAAVNETTPAISRAQMETNARAYLSNSLYYTQSMLTGYCAGRIAPRYLGTTPRTLWSVAYDWGGDDTIADYNRLLSSGYVAGDIDDSSSESCSRGVDCSGYLSRVWGLTSRKTSCSLSDVSTQIAVGSLMKGDIVTKCGVHVAMYAGPSSNGLYTYESTAYAALDRVVYLNTYWSRFNGYTPRRYVNVTGDSTTTVSTPVHVRSSAAPASGGIGMTATFSSTWTNSDGSPMTATLTIRAPWGSTYDFTMDFVSGSTTAGATFQKAVTLNGSGRYDYAITVKSTTTGRWSRYPVSGYASGPYVNNISYYVSPNNYWVCGQYPVTVRVGAYMSTASTVRFVITKGNNWCGSNGSFIANGVVDLRVDGIWGSVVASMPYYAGAPQVMIDYTPSFTSGSRQFYATIRNQGYWAGPITIGVQ